MKKLFSDFWQQSRELGRRLTQRAGGSSEDRSKHRGNRRVKTPTVLQMEAVECGAAALAIVMGYYGIIRPLEELRTECGVTRDGSKASNIVKAARKYGFIAKGLRKEPAGMRDISLPVIIHWNFNHFLVLEGFGKDKVYLNDPGTGPRTVSYLEFDESFTGIVLLLEPGPDFQKSGEAPSLWRGLRRRLAGAEDGLAYMFAVGLLLVIPGIVLPSFDRILVDDILTLNKREWLLILLIGMGVTVCSQFVLTWCREYCLLRFRTQLSVDSSRKFLSHVLRLPLEFFSQRHGGEVVSRVEINNVVAELLASKFANIALDLFMAAFFLLVLLAYDVPMTLVAIVVAAVNIVFLRYISRWRVDQNMKLLMDRAKLTSTTMGGLQIIESLKAGSNERDFFSRWAGYEIRLMNSEQKIAEVGQLLVVVPNFLTSFNTMTMLLIGGFKVMQGEMSMGTLMAYQALMTSFMTPVNNLVEFGSQLQELKGDMVRLDDVHNYPADPQALQAPPADGEIMSQPAKLSGKVELRNIAFGYNKLEAPLITDFGFCAQPGQRIALVGGSGCGKSTIAKLIAGLHAPWGGEILFDDRPRSQLSRYQLTNSLTSVDQDICLFEGTVRNNLTMWDETVSEYDVVRAAQDAAIHEEIAGLSGGYGHQLREGGSNFSGGQRQRLEIARALAVNPSIIVLDEATSALDPLTEKIVMDNLRRRGCTCVIIAHRLSTIRDCDEIIVLERGHIVQRGTHDEMKEVDGPYQRLISSDDGLR